MKKNFARRLSLNTETILTLNKRTLADVNGAQGQSTPTPCSNPRFGCGNTHPPQPPQPPPPPISRVHDTMTNCLP